MTKFFNLWVAFTLALFYLGPIPWEARSSALPGIYVVICMVLFTLGARLGGQFAPLGRAEPAAPVPAATKWTAIIVWMVAMAIHIQGQTGLLIFNPAHYSLDFGSIYANYQDTAENARAAGRSAIHALALLLKLALYVPVFLILAGNFRARPLMTAAILFPFIGSSMMRGTDKEMVDSLIFIAILSYHHRMLNRWVVGIMALLPVILLFFVERKIGRFEGNLPRCLPMSNVCFDFASVLAVNVSKTAEILAVFLTNYITQGYEGMYRAMSLPFEFNWGVGHLPPIKGQVCKSLGFGCAMGDFQQQLTASGWDTNFRWPSAYTVLANDLHWAFVPLYFGFLGLLHGVSEKSWKQRRDVFSLGTMTLIAIFIIYSSANMQLAISPESVLATLILFGGQTLRLVFQARDRVTPLRMDPPRTGPPADPMRA